MTKADCSILVKLLTPIGLTRVRCNEWRYGTVSLRCRTAFHDAGWAPDTAWYFFTKADWCSTVIGFDRACVLCRAGFTVPPTCQQARHVVTHEYTSNVVDIKYGVMPVTLHMSDTSAGVWSRDNICVMSYTYKDDNGAGSWMLSHNRMFLWLLGKR